MNKEKSKLIKKIKDDVETQLKKMGDAQIRFYQIINNHISDLNEIIYVSEQIELVGYKNRLNTYADFIKESIDDLNEYYQKQFKPFLDREKDE